MNIILLALIACFSIFCLWVNRKTLWHSPLSYCVLISWMLPFAVVPALHLYSPLDLILYQGEPFHMEQQYVTVLLIISLTALVCFLLGFFLWSPKHVNPPQSIRVSRMPSFENYQFAVYLVFIGLLGLWLIGIQLSYGLPRYLREAVLFRGGHPDLYEITQTGFMVPFARRAIIIPAMILWCRSAASTTWNRTSILAVAICTVTTWLDSGRGAVIILVWVLVHGWFGASRKRVPMSCYIAVAVFVFIMIVSGRTLFNYQVRRDGIDRLASRVEGQVTNRAHIEDRISNFGNDLRNLAFIYSDVGRKYDFWLFRDIAYTPFYVTPYFLTGVRPPNAGRIFTARYFPDHEGNVPPRLVGYCFWSFGWVGVTLGAFMLGTMIRFGDAWCQDAWKIPEWRGVTVVVAFYLSGVSAGYASNIVKTWFTLFAVILIIRYYRVYLPNGLLERFGSVISGPVCSDDAHPAIPGERQTGT